MSSISSIFRFFFSSLEGRLPSLVGFDKSLEDAVDGFDGLDLEEELPVGGPSA